MAQIETVLKISPRLLEHLGISAYNSVQKCLAELVANSYDADAESVTISLPDIIDENAVIEIEDNGTGMSSGDLNDKYLFVGWNRREAGQKTEKGRLLIGSKGIGKLAGFGIASRIHVVTWKGGEQSTVIIDRKNLDDLQTLSEQKLEINTLSSEHADGTKIQLIALHDDLHLPSPEAVRRHLFRVLPSAVNFKVSVNEVECSAETVPGDRHDFNETIVGVGTVAGFYIVANSRQRQPGLAVRVRGRIVQEPSLYGLDTRAHGFFTAEKIIGEVNAEFLDPEVKEEGSLDYIKTTRDGFLDDADLVKRFSQWAADYVKKIIEGVDESETKKRTDTLLALPAVKERLGRLPPHIKGTATKVVRSVISKLKTASDDDAQDLIEWILRYYESSVLKELMRTILAADVKEAEKLSELLQEWGLAQVNSVVDSVRTQVDIIQRLEELVASDKAKEIELHKLVEANLWLVREGLEVWSSDKPLKALLDKQIDKIYKDKEAIRPDLVCRSRNDGREAIILEFKRPAEEVVMDHVTQALEYEAIIKAHRPGMRFETFVVGRQYHASVLAAREKLENASLHLWSFEEILQRARMRFEKILEILGK
jgi:hypothetical protein